MRIRDCKEISWPLWGLSVPQIWLRRLSESAGVAVSTSRNSQLRSSQRWGAIGHPKVQVIFLQSLSTYRRLYLAWLICGTLAASADTLYLTDGSVVTGVVMSETHDEIVLANRLYGDLVIERQDVLYRDGAERPDRVETYAITQDGITVIARLQRAVPPQRKDASSFNLLVPGSIRAVTDANGVELPFSQRTLGENTLATLMWDDLGQDMGLLTLTSVQKTVVSPSAAGQLIFRANYTVNQAQSLRVIVRYPGNFNLISLSPTPDVELDGLLIWNRQLRRQQRFQPQILFAP